MKKPVVTVAAIVLAITGIEVGAWWWMHPHSSKADTPVISYVPPSTGMEGGHAGTDLSRSTSVSGDPEVASVVSLPDVYKNAAPTLRCSTGAVYQATMSNGLGIHFAYFEWNRADVGSVFEAFRHMPEQCMGSIGMKLLAVEPTRSYQVAGETLIFDHTVFVDQNRLSNSRNPLVGAPLVHSFKAVWVAGLSNVAARDGLLDYQEANLRQARLKAAITRFRPAHARVFQGAVRGAANADAAWNAFEIAMLKDLRFE